MRSQAHYKEEHDIGERQQKGAAKYTDRRSMLMIVSCHNLSLYRLATMKKVMVACNSRTAGWDGNLHYVCMRIPTLGTLMQSP